MNVVEAYLLYCGGLGSGCNPEAGACGRHAIPTERLSDRAKRALETYVPVTYAKYQLARRTERQVAKATGGMSFGDNEPFDVVVRGRRAIEVKTLIEGRNDKVTVHPDAKREKETEQEKQRYERVFTVACDLRGGTPTWYVKPGIGSYRLSAMEKLDGPGELKRVITAGMPKSVV